MQEQLQTVNVTRAAEILGVHPWTLYRWVREGKIPAVKLGRSVRFRVTTLEEWLRQKEQEATKNGPAAD